ncbi:hypothetical protein YTPLAS18_30410 [Nitrospira sp.]|nr:hypothetical protein YTPLAS18_30410 [Nitrospira sp.]
MALQLLYAATSEGTHHYNKREDRNEVHGSNARLTDSHGSVDRPRILLDGSTVVVSGTSGAFPQHPKTEWLLHGGGFQPTLVDMGHDEDTVHSAQFERLQADVATKHPDPSGIDFAVLY